VVYSEVDQGKITAQPRHCARREILELKLEAVHIETYVMQLEICKNKIGVRILPKVN
jgi:hypothetical protein